MPPITRPRNGSNTESYMFGTCGALLGESYFSTDGDDGVSKVEQEAVLSWRGDPLQTFSDWTIIVATSEFDSKTYHVHKSMLSVGPRSSRYFSRLFLEGSNRYNQSQSSTRIELDEQDADSFPLFLDFMYDTCPDADDDESLTLNVNEDFSTLNAVSLRHLARVFDCEGLMLAVNKFIQKDLSLKTGPVYLVQAHLYRDDRLIESAKRLCIENFSRLEIRSITRLPLELFKSVMAAVIKRIKNSHEISIGEEEAMSSHLSEVVCQYFEKHPDQMTVRLLLELTNENVMPKIASEPAIGFTALARELNAREIKPDSDEWRGLVALCQRCAQAVVGEYGWKDFNIASALEEYLYGPCAGEESTTKLDSLLFATSFAAALERAQNDIQLVDTGSSKSKKQIENLKRENEDLQWQNQSMKDEVERYKTVLAGTKDELVSLKQQVKELKRRHRAGLDELACV
mmetsp:Transcript_17703/g.40843  ORF Transcript_17703/g.40843 Transcript_17703/m.40843 type:complete len:457 (-) Transcript_17703:149-1519(-)|eukprot:CAMPEP_0197190314 /NCGR_PEP_ID=MMETSP1423-20130617/21415_1 /TAXON_ID=476441 /ORGANISM="Pseudo-nitzschia heimii, Strain UNC1101" /LENGTH=456 /DNA_ID=CAMNT_0042642665 /DNA_START=267 /DNA_END=1637 /DNA_ORIENTATION=-